MWLVSVLVMSAGRSTKSAGPQPCLALSGTLSYIVLNEIDGSFEGNMLKEVGNR
jgi:hypothetical protein